MTSTNLLALLVASALLAGLVEVALHQAGSVGNAGIAAVPVLLKVRMGHFLVTLGRHGGCGWRRSVARWAVQ